MFGAKINSNLSSHTLLDPDKMQVGEKKWVFLSEYAEEGSNYYNFKARSTDTWVISFPRSGTHWTMEMVWLLSNNLDFDTAGKKMLEDRFPCLGLKLYVSPKITKKILEHNKLTLRELYERSDYEVLDALESPRFIYSHVPPSLIPNVINSGCKVVYVARNPKDVVVSLYFMNKYLRTVEFDVDFPTFWNKFKNDLLICNPYWEHLKESWALKDNPNFLFLFYEEMKADLSSVVKKVSTFLGKVYSDEELSKLIDNLDFKNFKNNPMRDLKLKEKSNGLVREGKSANWKSIFTEELEKDADEWITENLKDTDLVFPIENLIS